jgi:replication fork protection complex subunit Tof1/Swi1
LLQNETLRHLLTLLIPSFANAGKDDKEDRVISLGLHVVRNLLAIKDVVAADRATGETEELSTLQVGDILEQC